MNVSTEPLKIAGGAFYTGPLPFAEFKSRVQSYLGVLRNLSSVFEELDVLIPSEERFIPLGTSESSVESAIVTASYDTSEAAQYIDLAADGTLSSHSYHQRGFSLHVVSREGLKLAIRGGAVRLGTNSDVLMTLPASHTSATDRLSLARSILQASIDSWQLTVAHATYSSFEHAIAEVDDVYAGKWLLYLPVRDLKPYLPADVTAHTFANGTLVQTTPHIPSAASKQDVLAGLAVRQALDSLGYIKHSHYAVNGWPPDEEEWRYEEFISGAPRGRKYRVRCIDFDGYDAQRNVLLYAKLFRQLRQQRKEWGLRGWDGPVLNEAKRQVRAANGMQIEWHIGLEEPAARVRTLLADYTDFKDHQLRVIYTPLSQALG